MFIALEELYPPSAGGLSTIPIHETQRNNEHSNMALYGRILFYSLL
jgi:hypothetical protein